MVSLGMLIDRPLSMAVRSAGLLAGSAPLLRAATEISRMILVKILPRLASEAFLRASMEGPRPIKTPAWRGKRAILLDAGTPDATVGTAPAGGACGRSVAEPPLAQERPGLRDRLGREQQAAVAGLDHHVVGQLGAAGLLDRNRAVVVPVELRQQAAQPVRQAAGDHADLEAARPLRATVLQDPRTAPQPQRCHRPAR